MADPVSVAVLLECGSKSLGFGLKIYEVVKTLREISKETSAGNEKIFKEFEVIKQRLQHTQQNIDQKLDEQILRTARSGLNHLSRGVTSDIESVKLDEFRMARSKFSELASLDPTQKTGGIENKYLIGVGYWGNYHYFNLRCDLRNALIQIYECTKKCPVIGVDIFPSVFFSRDYREIIRLSESLKYLHQERIQLEDNISKKLVDTGKHYLSDAEKLRQEAKKDWWNPVGGTMKKVEAFGNDMVGGAYYTAGFLSAASKPSRYPNDIDIVEQIKGESQNLNHRITEFQSNLDKLITEITTECSNKIRELERIHQN